MTGMRILFVIKSMEIQGGGAERVLADVANGLASRGHEITIVTFDRPRAPSFYPLDSRISLAGMDISPPGVPTPRLRLLAGLWRLRCHIRMCRPDLVVGFMHSAYVPLALAMLGTGTRMVASEHVGMPHFRNRYWQKLLVNMTDRHFVAKTVPSVLLREELLEEAGRSAHVLPNPLSITAFSDEGVNQDQEAILLCVGRFRQEKGHASLLEAFATVAGDFPEWRLRLVGDGELRQQIKAQVHELGLTNRVEMPGVLANVADEYRKSSVVVVPSFYESFGLVVIEALASGRPVLGFKDCLGPLNIAVDGFNALLVDGSSNRMTNLADGLHKLMSDKGLRHRLGKEGPASVNRFEKGSVVSEWERFLQGCVVA